MLFLRYLLSFILLSLFSCAISMAYAQTPLLGADLSYINEMEDCGAVYYDDDTPTDPFTLFANHGCQLVRLRLWHTPSWYDTLNNSNRYSDLADVKKSITRTKANNMKVLLNFHLSDFWADPSRQWVPEAWAPVVDDLPVLSDSLYNYIFQTLEELTQDDLLPDIVQIGNETNRGILLSIEENDAGWVLDWERNSALFNRAIQAVRDFENQYGQSLQIALHFAGPDGTAYFLDEFLSHGVTDFDIVGMSYYWHWHQPHTIEDVAGIISAIKNDHPAIEVLLMETGYIWTWENTDAANNIVNSVYPGYPPPSPESQKNWLTALTEATLEAGALGVVYWEPAWVSTPCFTPWAQGSHYDNATFFDFDNHVLEGGGMDFFSYPYTSDIDEAANRYESIPQIHQEAEQLVIQLPQNWPNQEYQLVLFTPTGQNVYSETINTAQEYTLNLDFKGLPYTAYWLCIYSQAELIWSSPVVK